MSAWQNDDDKLRTREATSMYLHRVVMQIIRDSQCFVRVCQYHDMVVSGCAGGAAGDASG